MNATLWLLAGDLEASVRFYASVLGLDVAVEERRTGGSDDGKRVAVTLTGRGLRVRLVRLDSGLWPAAAVGRTNRDGVVLEVRTTDIAADYRAFESAGHTPDPVRPGPRAGERWFTVRDPDGTLVAIVQEYDALDSAVA